MQEFPGGCEREGRCDLESASTGASVNVSFDGELVNVSVGEFGIVPAQGLDVGHAGMEDKSFQLLCDVATQDCYSVVSSFLGKV